MQYMCLIYSTPDAGPAPGTPEFESYLQAHFDLTNEATKKGAYVSGNALQGVETATTVSLANGKIETTDGPFAETTEVLGGYYLLECNDMDEAVAYAARIPTATHGRIEVRPVMVFD